MPYVLKCILLDILPFNKSNHFSIFEEEFSKPKVHKERQLTKLIKQRLKLKKKRPTIEIGPIRGRKLRLNEKKYKFSPMESKVKVEKITTDKVNTETAEVVEVGDAKSVNTVMSVFHLWI